MNIQKVTKLSFVVIGKEGSTLDGPNFIQMLWQEASSNFNQVSDLAKRNENGTFQGFWGAMSDFTHSFKPWQNNFSEGLYLAGVECKDDAQPPLGWTKWVVPSYEYLVVECESNNTFVEMIAYLKEHNLPLVGAVHDYTDPTTQKNYMYFPIRKL